MAHDKTYRSFYSRSAPSAEEDEFLLKPVVHLDVSALLEEQFYVNMLRAFNYWLKVPQKTLDEILVICEMMYARETLIDDVQDRTDDRLGTKAAHVAYGLARTMNSIIYLTFVMLEKIADLKFPVEAVRIHTEKSLECCRGQGMELKWREFHTVPTEEEYVKNTHRKTATSIFNGVELMQLYSNDKRDFSELIRKLGVFFQIYNDFINLRSKRYMDSKSYCEDITEGKFSFPIIHAIYSKSDDKRVLEIMKQRPDNNDVKKYCLSIMEEFGSLDYTHEAVLKVKNEIFKLIKEFGGNPILEVAVENHYKNFKN